MFLEKKISFCTTLQILKAQGGRYFDANLVRLQNDPRILEELSGLLQKRWRTNSSIQRSSGMERY